MEKNERNIKKEDGATLTCNASVGRNVSCPFCVE